MTTNTTHSAAIALNASQGAPEWIELIPAGRDVKGRDGRAWVMENPDAVVAAFEADGQPVPLDYEHASQHKAPKGEPAPAAGWIEQIENRGGAIWAKVEWTERGRASVASREYRFVSPGFIFNKVTKAIVSLIHAGLTNQPNFKMTALNHTDPENEDVPMDLKPVTDVLGLTDGANTGQIVAAINSLKASETTALNRAENPDTEKFVPKADYDLAMNKVSSFETAEKKRAEAEITETVDALIAKGDPNHPPAKREDYIAMCRAEGGLDRFKRLFAADLETALNKTETADKTALAGGSGLTDEEKAVCRATGTSEEDFLKAKKEDAAV